MNVVVVVDVVDEGNENVEDDVCVDDVVKDDVYVNQNVKDDVVYNKVDADLSIDDVEVEDLPEAVVTDNANDEEVNDDDGEEDVEVVT